MVRDEPFAPVRLLCPVYPHLANTPCFSKAIFPTFPRGIDWSFRFFPTGFVSFLIVQPNGSYHLAAINSLPSICTLGMTDWRLNSIFTHSCTRWIPLPKGIGLKPLLSRPILSRKMFVSPCPSHKSGASKQADPSRPAILFLLAMFFSCHFLLHIPAAFRHRPV